MPDRKIISFFSRRSKGKSPGPGLSSIDAQPPHPSAPLLQVPQISVTASETAQEPMDASIVPSGSSRDPRTSSFRNRLLQAIRRLSSSPKCSNELTTSPPERPMSTTSLQPSPHNSPLSSPSLDSGERVDYPRSALNAHATHDTGAREKTKPADVDSPDAAPLSVPTPLVSSSSDNDRKKTIISSIKLLLQTAATALHFAPIPNLDQIPNTLLTWIQIYEVSTLSV